MERFESLVLSGAVPIIYIYAPSGAGQTNLGTFLFQLRKNDQPSRSSWAWAMGSSGQRPQAR